MESKMTEQVESTTPVENKPVEQEVVNPFTQAQVDAIVKDRLARKDKQFADYDDIKAKAIEFDKLEEANKTELEKAQAEAVTARAEADSAIAEAQSMVLRSAIIAKAAAVGFQDPADAYALIDRADLNDDGIDDALKTLAEKKPYMLGKAKPPKLPPTNPGADAVGDVESEKARRLRLGI